MQWVIYIGKHTILNYTFYSEDLCMAIVDRAHALGWEHAECVLRVAI